MTQQRPLITEGARPRRRPDLAIYKFADRLAMDYTASDYEIINLGTNRTVRLMEVVTGLEKVLGKSATIEYLPMRAGDVPQTLADIGKAHELLGYSPRTDFLSGVARYTEWLKNGASQSLGQAGN